MSAIATIGVMKMTKIEPMSVEQMKAFLSCVDWDDEPVDDVARVILAWIHAEAQRRRHEFWADWWENLRFDSVKLEDDWRQYLDDDEWLLEVKREVGWPEGE